MLYTHKPVFDALGTDGTTVTDSATTALGAVGANNNNNAFDSSSVVANSNGSVLERLEHILVAIGGTTGTTTSAGAVDGSTGISTSLTQANDYWNGGLFICVDGTNAGLARPISDFTAASDTANFEPAFPNQVASGVNFIILSRYDVARILGDNNANNAYDSTNVAANENGSILERLEDVVRKLDVASADAADNTVESDVVGNKTDAIPAMNAAPGADSLVAHVKAILERIGATPADPDDSVLTNIGQRDDTATLDDVSDVTTTSMQAKLRRILLRFSSDAFSATIQGGARTDVETMLGTLATYFSSGGAAWSVTADPGGAARDNLEQTIEDLAAVLAGAGITTFPARAVAGDGASLAEVLRHASESIGEDTANNVFDSSSVVANIDGSVLERLEAISSGIIIGTGTFTTSSTTVPADTGQAAKDNNYFKGGLLIPLTGAVAFQPRLITSSATATGVFTLDAEEPFTAAPGLVTYVVVSAEASLVPTADGSNNTTTAHVVGNRSDAIPAMNLAPGTDTVIAHLKAILERVGATPSDPDDSLLTTVGQRDDAVTVAATASVVSLLRDLIAALGVVASGAGGGFEIDGTPSLVTALGTTGSVVTDSATSVLGAIGADNANNAFDSTNVAENGDGSVLERLEEIRGGTTTGTHNIEIADGTTEVTVADVTPTRHGRIAVELDVNTLITAGEGGTIIVRLKSKIDGATLRTIDRYDFTVASSEVHPTVSGFVYEGATTARVTIQLNSAVAAQRAIPYRIIEAA